MRSVLLAPYVVLLALVGCGTSSSDPDATAESARPSMLDSEVSSATAPGDTRLPAPAQQPDDRDGAASGDAMAADGAEPNEADSVDPGDLGASSAAPMEESLSMEAPPGEGSTGDQPSGGAAIDPADTYSDDFSDDTLASWSLRHQEVGEAPQYTLLDIDRTRSGALTIEPTRTPGWFAGGTAPLIFKRVSGDFSVEVDVLAESAANPGEPPGANFNSAGLMARDPSSDAGSENYVMVNLGRQNGGQSPVIGTESKTTRNSSSTLDIQLGTNRGRLILCRVGSDFRSYRLLDNEVEWRRIASVPRPDLPDSLQVGMVANGFEGPDLRATFFEISLRVPQSLEDCTPR